MQLTTVKLLEVLRPEMMKATMAALIAETERARQTIAPSKRRLTGNRKWAILRSHLPASFKKSGTLFITVNTLGSRWPKLFCKLGQRLFVHTAVKALIKLCQRRHFRIAEADAQCDSILLLTLRASRFGHGYKSKLQAPC